MRRFVVALGALAASAACVSLAGSTGGNETSEEAGVDAGTEASIGDASASADGGVEAAGDAGCPSAEGPAMIRAGSFCIDSTEVTNGQYEAFLNADPPAVPAECGWKASFVPSDRWPPAPGSEKLPVAYVDWCDGYAYCAWTGKHLCGRIGGGALLHSGVNDATKDQWYAACSRVGERVYPYGDDFDPNRCALAPATYPDEVASNLQCEGGYGGLFDMSGNLQEWIDSCASALGAEDRCTIRGGSISESDAGDVRCTSFRQLRRDERWADVGIRCCAE
jgi:formylglycine-generating enzyme required for sulfatase activity